MEYEYQQFSELPQTTGLTDADLQSLIQSYMSNFNSAIRVGRSTFGANFFVDRTGSVNAASLNQLQQVAAGQDLAAGLAVSIGADGKAYLSDALYSYSTGRYAGVVKTGCAAGEIALIQNTGINDQQSGLTAGAVYFLQDGTVDQYNTTTNGNSANIAGATWWAQTFTPAVTGYYTTAQIKCQRGGTGVLGDVTLSIRATSGGSPTGADLATAPVADTTFINNEPLTVRSFQFTTPILLTAGTVYALVMKYPAGSVGVDYLVLADNATTSVYAGGSNFKSTDSGSTWAADTNTPPSKDFWFKMFYGNGTIGSSSGTTFATVGLATEATKIALL